MTLEEVDRTGLIRESYAIEAITPEECRSIFLDWALGLSDAIAPRVAIPVLLETYAKGRPDHPMTVVLTEGLAEPTPRGRRRAFARR